ncbi:MAG TPA: pyridoxamine 5'-phosphate oxidase family protein [Woeseiaceae bacterium]|nr:pyridoxamine 5'-phosphate oxidase family protein [Woeseiaceae bacterium]
MSDRYPLSPANTVRQLRDKARYDRATVAGILAAGQVAAVGFVQDGAPVVVPMMYGVDGDTLYLHGARKARVIRLLEQTGRACVNVTLVDALVLARSAFNSSMNYRSVTLFGAPRLVESLEEKRAALRVISEHVMPGRWDELREPHERELKMTGVIALPIETASAKVSSGMPDDDPADYEIPVWAGILPLTSVFGTLQDDGRLLEGVRPSPAVLALEGRRL